MVAGGQRLCAPLTVVPAGQRLGCFAGRGQGMLVIPPVLLGSATPVAGGQTLSAWFLWPRGTCFTHQALWQHLPFAPSLWHPTLCSHQLSLLAQPPHWRTFSYVCSFIQTPMAAPQVLLSKSFRCSGCGALPLVYVTIFLLCHSGGPYFPNLAGGPKTKVCMKTDL